MSTAFGHPHAEAWDRNLVDVESLNARASQSVVARIDELLRASRERLAVPPASCTLVLGPPGAGKTHLFARWRKQRGNRAVFVLMRPGIGVLPSARAVLQSCFDSLRQAAVMDSPTTQLELLVGAALAPKQALSRHFPQVSLDAARGLTPEQRGELIAQTVDGLEDEHPELATDFLELLLRAPFAPRPEQRAILAFLAGRDLGEEQLAILGRARALDDHDVTRALKALAIAAAFGAPLVLVFDQLENLVGGATHDALQAFGGLVSEVVDTVPGVVVVLMALDAEWRERLRPALGVSQQSRMEEHRVELAMPTAEERELLVRRWIQALPEEDRRRPFPAPFTSKQLARWRTLPGLTPRALMLECQRALENPVPEPEGATPGAEVSLERLEGAWIERLSRSKRELDEALGLGHGAEEARLRSALFVALGVARAKATLPSDPRTDHQLELEREGTRVRVFLLQESNGTSAAGKVKRAAQAATKDTVLLLRQRDFAIPPTWKATNAALLGFQKAHPGRFLEIGRAELAQLVALHDLCAAARAGDLSDDEGRPLELAAVELWAEHKLAPAQWAPLRPLLGKPVLEATEPETARAAVEAPSVAAEVSTTRGHAAEVLQRLGVASIERLVSELRGKSKGVNHTTVVEELRGRGAAVRWLGPSVVALAELES